MFWKNKPTAITLITFPTLEFPSIFLTLVWHTKLCSGFSHFTGGWRRAEERAFQPESKTGCYCCRLCFPEWAAVMSGVTAGKVSRLGLLQDSVTCWCSQVSNLSVVEQLLQTVASELHGAEKEKADGNVQMHFLPPLPCLLDLLFQSVKEICALSFEWTACTVLVLST